MRDTIHALLMRELKTRFGAKKLGYFWALAEPIAQAAIFALLFTLIGRTSITGVPVALFLIIDCICPIPQLLYLGFITKSPGS